MNEDSQKIASSLSAIGQKHGLHIDQIGLLENTVNQVVNGNLDSEEFVDKIEEDLNIDTEKAIALATDVNLEVFSVIRKSLLDEQYEEIPAEPKQTISRESILSEIEDPTPVAHPISAVDQTRPGPAAPREILPADKKAEQQVAHDFIGGKLTETVAMPNQKVTAPAAAATPAPVPKPKPYSADPYREPIN